MKKFRVIKADGSIEIIEALNMENAISIARNKFGQLPNDINTGIVDTELQKIHILSSELSQIAEVLKSSAKEADWESAYKLSHKIVEKLVRTSVEISNQAGSMVKLSKEEEE